MTVTKTTTRMGTTATTATMKKTKTAETTAATATTATMLAWKPSDVLIQNSKIQRSPIEGCY